MNRANQANQRNVYLSPAALRQLERYTWPGNIRELGNVIERLVLLADGPMVSASELERFLPSDGPEVPPSLFSAPLPAEVPVKTRVSVATPPPVRDHLPAHSHTLQELRDTLAMYRGNKSRAAQALGMTARQFGYRLSKSESGD